MSAICLQDVCLISRSGLINTFEISDDIHMTVLELSKRMSVYFLHEFPEIVQNDFGMFSI